MNQPTNHLNNNQNEIFTRLQIALTKTHMPHAERIFAITGERGQGKTTVLSQLYKSCSEAGIFTTSIIDASVIPEEVGIFGTVIQDIHKRGLENLKEKPHNANANSTNESFQKLSTDIIRQQTAYKHIAKDMAMSPDHYIKIMQDWSKQSQNTPHTYLSYLKNIQNTLEIGTTIVVFLDDLDLATPETLQIWTKNMLGWHRSMEISSNNIATDPCTVFWVLTFEKDRFVRTLSPPKRELTNKSGNDMDTVIGNSLSSKLIPFQNQFSLLDWGSSEREEYLPIGFDKVKPLKSLIEDRGLSKFLPTLPKSPRGLTNIYHWLLARSSSPTESKVSATLFLEKIAETNGVLSFYRTLLNRDPFKLLHLPTTYAYWRDAVIHPIESNEPLQLEKTDHMFDTAELYIEQLCDISLAARFDFRSLLRITDQLEFFKKTETVYPYPNAKTITTYFREKTPNLGTAVIWSAWRRNASRDCYCLHTGPRVFWEALFLNDTHEISTLLSSFYLNKPTLGLKLDAEFAAARTHFDIMPQNLRGLLLLVDALARAPWLELSVSHKFWTPHTVVTCSAAFYLSAMASTIWPKTAVLWSNDTQRNALYWPEVSFSKVKQLDDGTINQQYGALLATFAACRYEDTDTSPLGLARKELFRAFQQLLHLGAVQRLAKA